MEGSRLRNIRQHRSEIREVVRRYTADLLPLEEIVQEEAT